MNPDGQESQYLRKDADNVKEKRDRLYRDYDLVFSLFKTDADIYYRSAQIILALQTALFAGFALKGRDGGLISAFICIVGGAVSFSWVRRATIQRQYLELRKRMLRDIEAQIPDGIQLMTIDQKVMFGRKGVREEHKFTATGETFPDQVGEFSISKVKGGATRVEIQLGGALTVVWAVLLLGAAIYAARPWLCLVVAAICEANGFSKSAVFE